MTRMLPLEVEAEHELQDAAAGLDRAGNVAVSAGHLAEGRPDVGIRAVVPEVGHVENVERGGAEFDVRLLADMCPLHNAGVEKAVPILAETPAPAQFADGRRTYVRLVLIQIGGSLATNVEGSHAVIDQRLRQVKYLTLEV